MKLTELFKNRKVLSVSIIIAALIAIYVGVSVFFVNHFTFGSYINGIDVAGKSIGEVEKIIADKAEEYSLQLKCKGGEEEEIIGKDIGVKYVSSGKVKKVLEDQNAFSWIIGIFKDNKYNVKDDIVYDKELLTNTISNLSCINGDNIVEPQSASLKYVSGEYEIVAEVEGNKVVEKTLLEQVEKAIGSNLEFLKLEENNCYEKPKYTKDSQEIVDCLKSANKYLKSNIIYSFGGKTINLDKETINKWISVNNDLDININSDNIRIFVDQISSEFNTYGDSRTIINSSGNEITISDGDYGWIIDKVSMIEEIESLIKDGQIVTKEPLFSQEAATYGNNDIGNSYLEIDLASQYLWLYVDGKCVLESDIVSGCVNDGNATPGGIYLLKYKVLDTYLRGEGYETKVAFWMPFNHGIGLHDATWRDSFGGDEYIYNGSHGCVNLPYNVAEAIYNNIYSGFPIICYYDYDAANKRNEEKKAKESSEEIINCENNEKI